MDEAIRNAAVFGALALGCGSFGWWPRWGWLAAACSALGALVASVVLGVFDPLAPALWVSAWPAPPLVLLAGWGLLAVGLRRVGGVGGVGPVALGAFLGGAAFGALPVALGLVYGREPSDAARITLAAVGGGLCGPLGSVPLLLLGAGELLPMVWPLGLALGAVAVVPGAGRALAPAQGTSPRILLALALPLWLLAVLVSPPLALGIALVLVWALVAWQRSSTVPWPSWKGALRLGSLLLCVLLLVPAGVLDFLAWGLDDARVLVGSLLDLGFGLAGLGLAALVGGAPVALAGALAAVSDPAGFPPGLRAALVAGAVVGGMVPIMVAAGPAVLRAGLGRWALAVLLLLGWLAFHAL